ncbi:MAG: hypothetical protein KAI40_02420 [Desulfobacterales bacterium]|nr:hypothetical protein [Desulfobacterales bacterium]
MTSNIIIFLIPITLLTLTPGVDTMLVIRNTSRGGDGGMDQQQAWVQ